ncbi:MAG: hypothetical protein JNL69_01150 [Bacteroidia bacterium]|nr:hypothetical protein [Bacteroidia bacterium]
MKKIFFILLLTYTSSIAQTNYKLVKSIEMEIDFFTTDNQSNTYVVKGNELNKFDKSGKLLYKYSNKNLGNIDFVDATNMLRVLVYYKNFSQVVFLDNTLSLNTEPVSFDVLGYQQVQLACSSHNNSMWIYDQQNFELIRLSKNYDKTQQTGNINLLINIPLQPNYLLEYDNKLYLNNPTTGILVFDIYGTYYKTIPVKNAEKIQAIGDWVYFKNENTVKAYNLKTTEETEFKMPLSSFNNFRLESKTLFIQTNKGISIYTEKE